MWFTRRHVQHIFDIITNLSSICELRLLFDFWVHLGYIRLIRVRLFTVRVCQGLCGQKQGCITPRQQNPHLPLNQTNIPLHTQYKNTAPCLRRSEGHSCNNPVTSSIYQAVVLHSDIAQDKCIKMLMQHSKAVPRQGNKQNWQLRAATHKIH